MYKRNSIILGLLFVILVVEIIIISPKDLGINVSTELAPLPKSKSDGVPGQVAHDVHLVQSAAQGAEWELWAEKAFQPKELEQWTIEQVKVKLFGNNGVTYIVTGQRGEVVPDKSDIKIMGNVETHSSNGYVFKTQSAFYNSKARHLTSPEEVEMTGPSDKEGGQLFLTGSELQADLGSNEISVNKNVKARRDISTKPGDNKVANIQSQRALFSGRTNQARFFGNVVIDVETMRITGPEASFTYDRKTEKVEAVTVSGGARLTDTDKFATAGTVTMQISKDQIEFRGSPRVMQNGDELVGDEITFLEGGKQVRVSNAKAQFDPKTMEMRK